MRNGSEANTVPGSTRWSPSTRMSRTVKGSAAQAGKAASSAVATAERVRPRRPVLIFLMGEVRSASQAGHIIEQGDGHEGQKYRDTSALQALHPDVGNAASSHTLPKIIHQVPSVQDGQRQQVEHPQTDADQSEKQEVGGQTHA